MLSSLAAVIAWGIAAIICVPLIVYSIEVAAGWPHRADDPPRGAPVRAVVLIPAHDEASGIAATLAALNDVMPAGTSMLVVADNCTDDTAEIARRHGATVTERTSLDQRGKGYALAHGRDVLSADPPDVVIVLDADCRLAPGSIEALCAATSTGRPAQAINLIAPDLSAPAMVQISSFAMIVKNLLRSRGMMRLGGGALLTGTGMAFPWPRFATAKLATGDIVEDLGLGIALSRQGFRPLLVGDARVSSASAGAGDLLTQRRRWEHGFLQTALATALPTVGSALRTRSWPQFLLGLHLLVPPLALLVGIASLALLLLAAMALVQLAPAGPAWATGLSLGAAALATIAAWARYGRDTLTLGALARAPLYIVWKIPLYLGFIVNRQSNWTRTRRSDEP